MKNLFILTLVAASIFSCNNPTPPAMENNTAKIEWVKTYFDHFNKHDWTKMAAMYTAVADFKDPSLGNGIVKQTREQTIKKYTELNQLFPDLHDEVVAIYPSGENHIVVEFVSTGTAPDQTKFELPICTIFTIENGLITKDFTYYDNFSGE
ncbi:MAG: nuclear transport factor 2 family protein [Bacteroidia bacterium]